jgi:thiamine-monophosphate kinase
MLSEFDIIQRYFSRPTSGSILGVGDDAALIKPGAKMALAVSTDMLVAGRHFFPNADPRELGHKSLAVNLSDMAAMGARPRWATLSLALPDAVVSTHSHWLEAFADGFFTLAQEHQVDLIGGDTTQGPLNICVTIMGEVEAGKALRRSGAKPGDDIWHSGELGSAALAVAHEKDDIKLETEDLASCLRALNTPTPRVALGQRLIGLAHSAIDVSDGLVADLEHIIASAKVSGMIRMDEINCSPCMKSRLSDPGVARCLLAGGDDYELCFTASPSKRKKIDALAQDLDIPLTRIGEIGEGEGLVVLDAGGNPLIVREKGYEHFRNG